MYSTLIFLGAGLMFVLLVVNIYIRLKVLKHYKRLIKAEVEFPTKYILDKKKLQDEIIPYYPDSEEDILKFSRHIQISLKIASYLLMLITLLAAVIYYYK